MEELENIIKMKQEAIERMKILKLKQDVIENFSKQDIIYTSEIQGDLLKANDEQLQLIKQFELKKNVKIYHIIHQKTESRDILFFLYVSEKEQEWENEKRDLKLAFDCAIVLKKETEIKEIGIKIKDGKVNVVV